MTAPAAQTQKIDQVVLLPNDPYTPYSVTTFQKLTAFRNDAKNNWIVVSKRTLAAFGYAFIAVATLIEGLVRVSLSAVAYLFSWLTAENGDRKNFYRIHQRLLGGSSINGILCPIAISCLFTNFYDKKL